MNPLIAIDLGNTFTHLTVVGEGGEPVFSLRRPTPKRVTSDWAERFVRRIEAPPACRSIVASVVPRLNPSLAAALLSRFASTPHFVTWQSAAGIDWQIPTPQTLGADRVCAVAGALTLRPPPLLVVDGGTAVTIDVLAEGPAYLGGAILPGIRAQFRALALTTAQLRGIPIAIPQSPLGQTTHANVQAGVLYGLAGGLGTLIAAYRERLGAAVPVIATGGGIAPLVPLLPPPVFPVPDLVLKGLLRIAAQELVP
ncbi:MAG TPA: type III pantothenate kinase [Candidatus Aminicenantes bacterium]|nr:type III pantothenate kinase [Candidatus Aminicenantes bacterium]